MLIVCLAIGIQAVSLMLLSQLCLLVAQTKARAYKSLNYKHRYSNVKHNFELLLRFLL